MTAQAAKTASPLQKTGKLLLRIFLVLLLAALLATGGGILWLRSHSGTEYIADILPGLLSGSGLELRFAEAEGPLPQRFLLRGVVLSDAQGEWLRVNEVEIRLSLLPLLKLTAQIDLVRAEGAQLLRIPETAASGEPEKDSTAPFSLVLPVNINLAALQLEDLSLPWSVLGIDPAGIPALAPVRDHALQLNLTAKGELAHGIAKAEANLSAAAGPDFEAGLRVPPLTLNMAELGSASLDFRATLTARLARLNAELAVRLKAANDEDKTTAPLFNLSGMGLEIAGNGSWLKSNGATEAELRLKSAPQASWQAWALAFTEMDQNLLSALADPLDLEATISGRTDQELVLNLKNLQAGIISGKGTAAANLADWLNNPEAPRTSRVAADLQFRVADLQPLAADLAGALAVAAKADGNLAAAEFSITLNSDKLVTQAGELADLNTVLSGTFSRNASGDLSLNGVLQASTASGPGGAVALKTAWQADIPAQGGFAAPLSAQVRQLDLSALGLTVQGDLDLEYSDAPAKASGLWPQNLKLNGRLRAAVEEWAPLAALAGMAISGRPASLDIALENAAQTQSFQLTAVIPSLALPEQGPVSLSDVTLDAQGRFGPAEHDLKAKLSAGPGAAAGFTWSGVTATAAGQAQAGAFSLSVNGPGRPGADMLAAKGNYDLAQMRLSLESFTANYPENDLGLRLQQPVTVDFADGLEIRGLDLALQPGGSIKAEALLRPGAFRAEVSVAALPLHIVNVLAGQSLPPGSIDLSLSARSGPNGPQGEVHAAVQLDNGGTGPDAQTGQSGPDKSKISLEAQLARSAGRLWLEGTGEISFLTPQPQSATAPPPGSAPVGTPPLTFRLPMRLNADGLPLPDEQGPLQASLDWTGQVAPFWQLLPMPDQSLTGLVNLALNLTGSLAKPVFDGGVYMAGGRYEDRAWGLVLADIEVEAAADQDQGLRVITSMTDGDKGKMGFTGALNPALDEPLNLRGQIAHMSPVHRDDLAVTVSGLVAVKGKLLSPKISADLIIEEGEVNIVSSLGGGSVPTLDISNPDDETVERGPSPSCDIKVDIPRRFFIRGRGLDSEWQGKLHITGLLSEPDLRGTLAPVRGTFDLLSKTFAFTGGEIEFAGGSKINPGLNLELTYTAANLTAIIRAGGTLDDPKITLESNPPLPQDEVLAHVLFGKNVSELSRFEALQLADGLRTLMGGGSGFDLLTNIREVTGFDVLRVGSSEDQQDNRATHSDLTGVGNVPGQTGGGPSGESGGATLEAGKYISDNIYVGVEQGISQEDTAVRVEVELFPNVSVQGSSSPNSSQIGVGWKLDY